MTDDIGMLQHANGIQANPAFGYCTDDNARALIVAYRALERSPSDPRIRSLVGRYFRFVQAAFVPEAGTFRNLLGYDRRWMDESGSGDSAGRSLWALGTVAGGSLNGPERAAAQSIFEQALVSSESWEDLRPVSNAILGICAFLHREHSPAARLILNSLAGRLDAGLEQCRSTDWEWPEEVLTYENARIPHALIEAGEVLNDTRLVSRGLTCLAWLMRVQTFEEQFSPVGNNGWYSRGGFRAVFDQQPIEAEASVSACAAAYRATHDAQWREHGKRAFRWFLGANAIGQPIGQVETGGCCDGLSESGVNKNQGAESTLAWLLALLIIPELTSCSSEELRHQP